MRSSLIAVAAAAFVSGGIATGAALSLAQSTPAAPAPAADGAAPPMHPGPQVEAADGPMGMRPHPMGPAMHHWWHRMHTFALIYPSADRNLDASDVKKIAEAFLLWNGNHSWKIADVAPTADGSIAFSVTTGDGSVVAKFTMDPHTARLRRIS
ncbi:hypothetical protein [Rhodopila sp.]|jgi:hypothetical protein|uniref:hypothetical protein n=1 Tax=Rhodopila sp. TaxID=2480087 RepID=UPI002C43C0C6|nr:hypothetical protein [Rhodopila sp.]HVZ06908.1 hypothetical protein [Rhodopila sp.]